MNLLYICMGQNYIPIVVSIQPLFHCPNLTYHSIYTELDFLFDYSSRNMVIAPSNIYIPRNYPHSNEYKDVNNHLCIYLYWEF